MIKTLEFTAEFNKSVPETLPTTPGGFTFQYDKGGNDEIAIEEITFDFEMSNTTVVSPTVRKFRLWDLDTHSFPESADITAETFSTLIAFTDIFVDLDLLPEDICVTKITGMEIEFDDTLSTSIRIPDKILDKYNKTLPNNHGGNLT